MRTSAERCGQSGPLCARRLSLAPVRLKRLRGTMATPPPEDPPDLQEEDHTHWQVVLSDPSSRKLVLYSPLLRRLAVHPTPPGSPRIAPGAARWTRSKAARGRSRGAGGGSGRDADGGRPPLSAPPRGPSRPGDSEAEGDDEEDEDDDDDEGGETPPAGTVGPPPSVCPLCLQDLPRGGPPPTDSSGRLGVGGSRHRARGARRAWLLPPPWADDLAADDGGFDEPPRWTPGRGSGSDSDEVRALSRAPARTLDGQSYFDLLSEVNSRATTPSSTGSGPGARALPHGQAQQGGLGTRASGAARLDEGQMNEGYFARFFDELQLLGAPARLPTRFLPTTEGRGPCGLTLRARTQAKVDRGACTSCGTS